MPDGDKVHADLPGPYQKGYKCLCEGQNAEEVVRAWGPALIKSLQRHGEEPVEKMGQIVDLALHEMPGPLFNDSKRRVELSEQVRKVVRGLPNKRTAGILDKTLRQVLNRALRNGTGTEHLVSEACAQYVTNVLEDSCLSRVQNTQQHYQDVDHAIVGVRMQEMADHLEEMCLDLGRQIERNTSAFLRKTLKGSFRGTI